MLGFILFCFISYFAFYVSQIYFYNQEHLINYNLNYVVLNNNLYNQSKFLINNAILIYFLEIFFNQNLIPLNGLLTGTFYLLLIINIIKISHGKYYNQFNLFLINLLKLFINNLYKKF